MKDTLRAAVTLLAALVLLTGAAYPALVTLATGLLFPRQAGGSLVHRDRETVGSRLVGRAFVGEAWFHGRPSAAARGPYDASLSGGTNLGPQSPAWRDSVAARAAAVVGADADTTGVPVDLVTASGSGLDPHISPAAAYHQAARVARARGLDAREVRRLVARQVEGRTWGVLGEPRVNVLALNLALDALVPLPPAGTEGAPHD